MTTKILFTVLSFCISATLYAQSYSESFATGNRGMYQGQCWLFSSTALKDMSTSAEADYWVRTGQLTNLTNPHTFGTPCTNFNTNGGVLKFDHAITTTAGSSLKRLDVVIVDENGNEVDTVLSHIYTDASLVQSQIAISLSGNYTIQWRWIGTGGRGRGLLDNVTIPGTNIADPSNGCNCNSSAFPVEWTHVEAWQADDKVAFNWGTASELNSDYFEVEHSIDGVLYQSLGRIAAAGTSTNFRSYDFEAPTLSVAQVFYYRIKQVDLDGQYSYSKVLTLETVQQQALGMHLYPNPAQDIVHVQLSFTGEIAPIIRLLDIQGKVVKIISSLPSAGGSFSIDQLAPGMYIVEARSGTDRSFKPLIIQ